MVGQGTGFFSSGPGGGGAPSVTRRGGEALNAKRTELLRGRTTRVEDRGSNSGLYRHVLCLLPPGIFYLPGHMGEELGPAGEEAAPSGPDFGEEDPAEGRTELAEGHRLVDLGLLFGLGGVLWMNLL